MDIVYHHAEVACLYLSAHLVITRAIFATLNELHVHLDVLQDLRHSLDEPNYPPSTNPDAWGVEVQLQRRRRCLEANP